MNKKYYFILMLAIFLVGLGSALEESQCVDFSISSISPSSVEIGESFTVGIEIENCGVDIPELVKFELIDISSQMLVKEPLSIDVGTLTYSNSKRSLIYHMETTNEAIPGEYTFKVKLIYGDNLEIEKEGEFVVTVTGGNAELNIASVKTNPLIPKVNEEISLAIRLENIGDSEAKSIKLELIDAPFMGTTQSFLGSLEEDEDGSSIFTLITEKSGKLNYQLRITYVDDYGEHSFTKDLEIFIQSQKQAIPLSRKITVISLISISVIGGIVYLLRRKRKVTQNAKKA